MECRTFVRVLLLFCIASLVRPSQLRGGVLSYYISQIKRQNQQIQRLQKDLSNSQNDLKSCQNKGNKNSVFNDNPWDQQLQALQNSREVELNNQKQDLTNQNRRIKNKLQTCKKQLKALQQSEGTNIAEKEKLKVEIETIENNIRLELEGCKSSQGEKLAKIAKLENEIEQYKRKDHNLQTELEKYEQRNKLELESVENEYRTELQKCRQQILSSPSTQAPCEVVKHINNVQQHDVKAYKYDNRKLSWDEAESACVKWGGHLVTIRNVVEHNFHAKEMSRRGLYGAWIGLNEDKQQGKFVWSSSKNSYFRMVASRQPDWGANRNCVWLWFYPDHSYPWYYGECQWKKHFICEASPQ